MSVLKANQLHQVTLTLNGRPVEGQAEPRMLLSDFLRHEIGATGTHVGCEHGVCGACTVRIDGVAARACLTLAVQASGKRIDTVEGLAEEDGTLSVLQQSFKRHHALQCGYCTAGILMSLTHYLEINPDANREQLREVIGGHLCRCTGYTPIVEAAVEAAELLRQNRTSKV
ncbi:(2Fe-2S)-binding protein [Lacisediminimonas sp.]|uniref:(2Fe-2S)-binding protein n=1 Tax=Lacisediminimonas sp. TaxID=3060582 RepID=UPI00271FE62B|nr:(2Fe-2S)-binding protein [Lacisediminimonas sp.]MDO8298266.1 (2Fe-2S)-binding protein [Lacisediminimonas sp.]